MNRMTGIFTISLSLALAAGMAVNLSKSRAADDDDEKAIQETVRKIAKSLADGKADEAKKDAAELAKKEKDLDAVMRMFKTKKAGGLGFGPKAEDGIEKKIESLAKKALSAAAAKNEAADLEKMAQNIAAMATVGDAYTPDKKVGNKDPKDWTKWMDDMRKGAADLAKAAKSQQPKQIKDAAMKVNSSCSNCHPIFKDS